MKVFLDLDSPEGNEELANILLAKFEADKIAIGERIKKTPSLGVSYSTQSVIFYHQARELFLLGYFEAVIMICRATAEYLASDIFVEQINIEGDRETIEKIAEGLDFRKIVNDFLYDKDATKTLIDKDTKDKFNALYDLGNKWIHPKTKQDKSKIEDEAHQALELLRQLTNTLRNVLKDYEIVAGSLKQKPEAKKYKRGIKLTG